MQPFNLGDLVVYEGNPDRPMTVADVLFEGRWFCSRRGRSTPLFVDGERASRVAGSSSPWASRLAPMIETTWGVFLICPQTRAIVPGCPMTPKNSFPPIHAISKRRWRSP